MTSNTDVELKIAQPGSVEHDDTSEIITALHHATADLRLNADDPVHMTSLLMTALPTFAGILFGELVVMGIAKDSDQKRTADSAARNFRQGAKVGKARAMRLARETAGGTA